MDAARIKVQCKSCDLLLLPKVTRSIGRPEAVYMYSTAILSEHNYINTYYNVYVYMYIHVMYMYKIQ